MKKKLVAILTLILMLPFSLVLSLGAFGSDGGGETNSITIIKYRIPQGIVVPEQPIGETEINLSGILGGQALERMPGVTYRITRMEEVDGEYFPMSGDDAMTMDIVTDANGVARTGPLPDGIYQVIEMPHELIPVRDEPIIIHLPLDANTLRNVIIYPKSNVIQIVPPEEDPPEDDPPEDGPTCSPEWVPPGSGGSAGSGSGPPSRLPQTSGNIGTMTFLLFMIAGAVAMGGYGTFMTVKKGYNETEKRPCKKAS